MPLVRDITGQRFGRLVALEPTSDRIQGRIAWKCTCDCGAYHFSTVTHLLSGNTTSCGCLKRDVIALRNKSNVIHGYTNSPTWVSWMLMRQRCTNPKHKSFAEYGGRGITICERWESFENFLADMGERPANHSLDRRDPNGNYAPDNCRWATSEEQANNKRTSRRYTYDGRTQTLAQWAREIGVSRQSLRYRLDNDFSIEEALTLTHNHGNRWRRQSSV